MRTSELIGPESTGGGRRAARAHEQLSELGDSGRHLHPWFERHQPDIVSGLVAELTLGAARSFVYDLPRAPGIACLTAGCLTRDRAIDRGQLQEPVKNNGEARHRLLFAITAEPYGCEQGSRSASCSPSWTAST
jgi:hypothetical protein